MKKLRHRKSPTAETTKEVTNMTFDKGPKLIFNMFSTFIKKTEILTDS